MNEDKKELVEIEVVYTGRCKTTDKKIGYKFLRLASDDPEGTGTGADGIFALKPGQVFGIGVYGVMVTPEVANTKTLDQIHGKTLRWKRAWKDKEQAALWEAEDLSFARTEEALKLAKGAKGSEIAKLCAPLADLYRGLSPFQRSAFMILVLNEVSSPTKIRKMEEGR